MAFRLRRGGASRSSPSFFRNEVTIMKLIAPLIFLVLVARWVSVHGKEWEFSRHGIPVSIVSADRRTYGNGRPIDAVNLAFIRSGNEEKVMGGMMALFGGAIFCWAYQVAKLSRITSDSQKFDELMREVKRLRGIGKWAEAEPLMDQCGEIVERMKRRAKQ